MISRERITAFLSERLVYGKIAVLILWISYAITILLGDGYGTFNLKGELACADHLAFYSAAQSIRQGHSERVYDYPAMRTYQNEMFPGRWYSLEAFRNPPFFAYLYFPTAFWSYPASAWFWSGVYLLALMLGTRWVLNALPAEPRIPYWSTLTWLLSFYPVFCAFTYGQNTLLSYLIFGGTYVLLARERPFLAGMVAGLLWIKPTLLLGLGVWCLIDIRKKWSCALGFLLATVGLGLISSLPNPILWEGFVTSLPINARYTDFEQWKMHNPLAFWRLALPEELWSGARPWHLALSALVSLAVILGFYRLWQVQRDNLPVMYGAVIFMTLLATPHALIYEWAILGITGILWWPIARNRLDIWLLRYVAIWVVLFISTDVAKLMATHLTVSIQWSVPVLLICWFASVRTLRQQAVPVPVGPPGHAG